MNGRLVKRPAANHPNRDHWEKLRAERRLLQTNAGKVYCGCCPQTEDQEPLQLHHRHYDSFGYETVEDVILLCEPCHDAITNRLRTYRQAHGDRSKSFKENVDRERKKTRQVERTKIQVTIFDSKQLELNPERERPKPFEFKRLSQ